MFQLKEKVLSNNGIEIFLRSKESFSQCTTMYVDVYKCTYVPSFKNKPGRFLGYLYGDRPSLTLYDCTYVLCTMYLNIIII